MAIKAGMTLMKGHDLKAYVENIAALEDSMRKDIMSKSVRAWTQPVAKKIKELAPVGDEDESGRLKKSISRRHRSYKKGQVHVGMAGPAATGSKVAPHWNLMEFGTVDRWHKRKRAGILDGFAGRHRKRVRRAAMRRMRRAFGLDKIKAPQISAEATHIVGDLENRMNSSIGLRLLFAAADQSDRYAKWLDRHPESFAVPRFVAKKLFTDFGRGAVNFALGRGRFTGRVPGDTFAFIRPGFVASRDEAVRRMTAKAKERTMVALRGLPNKA